ncbi:histone demethylation 3d [Fusarium tjaetaba]|uniref:Histone demethylation 3d n=1 Tax=Fusarium tjaetaba TaxID=1567544 RepID=A0A8H5RTS5_9HYPO|nr:histone demethylation 3d [Fusarium tjaetaba]KAF5638963.1 histone demethylation 3d [Fusarium tjaetaba]
MHQEDANFGSVNVGFAGMKAFLLVDTRYTEMCVRDTIPDVPPKGKCCDQWVRHLSIFRPRQLDGAGERFTILVQRVGDLIFKKRKQHYQVITIQDSRSLSINYTSKLDTPSFFDAQNPLCWCQT